MVKKFQKTEPESSSEEEEFEFEDIEDELVEEKQTTNDVEALNAKTLKIKEDFYKFFKGKNVNWIEAPIITNETEIDQLMDVDDDIKRELGFYNVSFQNAINGINHLKKVNFED